MSNNMNIVLIGFMGVGKTTIGRRAASKLGIDFYDTDEFIKKCEKMSVEEIIRKKGSKYFEGAQRFAVANLVDNRNCLISTGGNTVCDEYNKNLLKKNAVTIWLKASAQTIYENTKHSRNKRPEIAGATLDEIDALLRTKEVYYEDCDMTINVDDMELNEIADLIAEEYNKLNK